MVTCTKCQKTMNDGQFYTLRDGSKPDLCKKCMTMHIDNFNEETFLWLLEMMDVPYVPSEWIKIRDKAYAKNPAGMNGMSVFGKYLSNMKLVQWRDYYYADTEKIQAKMAADAAAAANQKAQVSALKQEQDALIKEQFEKGEISEAQYKTLMSTETQYQDSFSAPPTVMTQTPNMMTNPFGVNNNLPQPNLDLSEEDMLYLSTKWGRLYQPHEWVELEKTYKEMMNSFDIQDADTINTLIFICKTNLKMNQAVDMGDLDSFQKLSKTYNDLRKTAKLTAAQNKEEKSDFVDSVGELVAYCEKNGGQIPKYEIEVEYDIVDKVINDLKDYTKSLIYEDTALARQIEEYIQRRDTAEQQKRDREEAKGNGLDEVQLTDEDFQELNEFNLTNLEQDEKIYDADGGEE